MLIRTILSTVAPENICLCSIRWHGEEQAYDIRDFAGFDHAKTLAANIQAAYMAGAIGLGEDGSPYITWEED